MEKWKNFGIAGWCHHRYFSYCQTSTKTSWKGIRGHNNLENRAKHIKLHNELMLILRLQIWNKWRYIRSLWYSTIEIKVWTMSDIHLPMDRRKSSDYARHITITLLDVTYCTSCSWWYFSNVTIFISEYPLTHGTRTIRNFPFYYFKSLKDSKKKLTFVLNCIAIDV